jgi:hypothetical protein
MNGRSAARLKAAYATLPGPARRIGAFADYLLSRQPRVLHNPDVHPADRLVRGSLTVSLDFELAWAWQYSRRMNGDIVARGLHERQQVPKIIHLFDQYGIPATWATVGHLFLERCERGADGRAHADMPRLRHFETPLWVFSSGDYYQFDPCTDVRRDPAWYAPDLVGLILASRVNHEVACHGFSHAGFGDYCPPEVAAAELDACARAMAPYGLKPTTMVFPRHDGGNFATLAQKGVHIVRSFPYPSANISLPIMRGDGMWGVHVSTGLDRGEQWTAGQRLNRLKKFVDTAAKERLNAHVWLHPSLSDEQFHDALEPLVRYAADLRDRGILDILTMKDLVKMSELAMARKTGP